MNSPAAGNHAGLLLLLPPAGTRVGVFTADVSGEADLGIAPLV